jgi:hypothetical protein
MKRQMTSVCLSALLMLSALFVHAQAGVPVVDWKGIEAAWTAYYNSPSEAGAEKLLSLLSADAKILDTKDGFLIINSIFDHLGILEGEIYSGRPNAIKLGFRLYAVSYGTFEVALNKITGNLIAFNPRLFLEELSAHRGLLPSLEPILTGFLKDMPDDLAAQELEKKLRIKSLESVDEKSLKTLRNECIKILKKM